eukprot:5295331-Alexandrium_andersonii.AAC.1
MGGTVARFVVPVPWQTEPSARVQTYMDSEWRREDMTLLEFLRKTNKDGAVHKALRHRFAALQRAAAPE